MSLRPAIARATRPLLNHESCFSCRLRVFPPVRRYAAKPKSNFTITREQQKSMSPTEMRTMIDDKQRVQHFNMMTQNKHLHISPRKSIQIVRDFLAAEKNHVDPATNINELAKKHKCLVGDISYVAMVLFLAPKIPDPSGRLPPSQNQMIAKNMLVACSAANDVFATLQILNSSYLGKEYSNISQANAFLGICTASDFSICEANMRQLADKGDGNCLTMQGLMLQAEGRLEEAKAAYRKALEVFHYKFDPRWPHPAGLPWIPPWRALSELLLRGPSPTAEAYAEAKAALEKGAFKGDDPLAYFELASFEVDRTLFWYKCMSKAAASGHIEAAYNLGRFHLDASKESSSLLQNEGLRKSLNYALSWKGDSLKRLAKEWFEVAASGVHKPAMLELAGLHEDDGNWELAIEHLQRIIEPPSSGEPEEWPQHVQLAKMKLVDVRKRLTKSRPLAQP